MKVNVLLTNRKLEKEEEIEEGEEENEHEKQLESLHSTKRRQSIHVEGKRKIVEKNYGHFIDNECCIFVHRK